MIGIGKNRSFIINPIRLFSAGHTHTKTEQTPVILEPVELDSPNFFQKVALRFKGIPLKGEARPPKSLFDDCDKEYVVLKPIPTVSKDYKEHPERDLVNFPYPERHPYPPKTRLFMIPNSWCTPFEKITGTSGPYLFFGGIAVFLNSKEIFVMDENAMKLFGFWSLYWVLSRSIQFRLDKYLHSKFEEAIQNYKNLINEELKDAVNFRKESASISESLKGSKENFPIIFKENLALQLEAVYRKNVNKVITEIQRRIDYLKEVEETKLRFERDILLKTITNEVQKKITNNEGNIKDLYLDNCIAQLKTLSN